MDHPVNLYPWIDIWIRAGINIRGIVAEMVENWNETLNSSYNERPDESIVMKTGNLVEVELKRVQVSLI